MNDMSFFLPKKGKSYPLPLFLTEVKAGFPSPADDFIERELDLNELVTNPPATYFVRVEGESMKDAHIFPGDILVVDRSIEVVDKRIVIAVLNGEFTVKRFRIINGQAYLASENTAFPPIKVAQEDDFKLFGVVSYIIHKAI